MSMPDGLSKFSVMKFSEVVISDCNVKKVNIKLGLGKKLMFTTKKATGKPTNNRN